MDTINTGKAGGDKVFLATNDAPHDIDPEAMHHLQMMDQPPADEEPCHDPWVS